MAWQPRVTLDPYPDQAPGSGLPGGALTDERRCLIRSSAAFGPSGHHPLGRTSSYANLASRAAWLPTDIARYYCFRTRLESRREL